MVQLFYVSFVQRDGLASSHYRADRDEAEKLFNDMSGADRYSYVAWGLCGEEPENEYCRFAGQQGS